MGVSALDAALPETASPLIAFFQPIVSVTDGRIAGLEALARRTNGDTRSAPLDILASLDADGRFALFCRTLKDGIRLCKSLGSAEAGVHVSINVDASLALRADFADAVRFILDADEFHPARVVVEILEGEAIHDPLAMGAAIQALKSIGLSVALDDVGSAYASLSNIKDLPVDILKLDQGFSRGLAQRPNDLQFVWSLLSLARGLDKILVVEGVETPEVYDALSILGVEYAQGFAIARPMPSASVVDWVRTYRAPSSSRTPRTLLGAYASHLTVVETCQMLMRQPLPITWKRESRNPHSCEIGRFFDQTGIHDGACGLAHKRFHQILARYTTDRVAWEHAARAFRDAMAAEIIATQGIAARGMDAESAKDQDREEAAPMRRKG